MVRKKLYYIPGMISLLGLPILLLFFVSPPNIPYQRILAIHLPSDGPENNYYGFTKYTVLRELEGKKPLSIDLNEPIPSQNPELFSKKLAFLTREIERIQFLNDTSCFLKIHFGENNTYGHFVWLLNQANIYHFRRYAFFDNCFYLLGNAPTVIDTSKVITTLEL